MNSTISLSSFTQQVSNMLTNMLEITRQTESEPMGHLQSPQAPINSAALRAIFERFLGTFEYVQLDYPVSGEVGDPKKPLDYHPHLHFRLCSDDRKESDPDRVQVTLAREIDRGIYLLKRLGLEVEDFYLSKEEGELRFDAHIPNPPAGLTEREALQQLADQLQEACTQIRSQEKTAGI